MQNGSQKVSSQSKEYLFNETTSATNWDTLGRIVHVLHNPKLFSKLRSVTAAEIINTPQSKLPSILEFLMQQTPSRQLPVDANAKIFRDIELGCFRKELKLRLAFPVDDRWSFLRQNISLTYDEPSQTLLCSTQTCLMPSRESDRLCVCRLAKLVGRIEVSTVKQLAILGSDGVRSIVQRFYKQDCEEPRLDLSLLVNGVDIVEQVDVIFNKQFVETVSKDEMDHIFDCLNALWSIHFEWDTDSQVTPTVDILAEMHPDLVENMFHMAEFGPNLVRRCIISHLLEFIDLDDESHDIALDPDLAETVMKIIVFGAEFGADYSSLVNDEIGVLTALYNSESAWCIVRNLRSVRRVHYFTKLFDLERRSGHLYWTTWFVSGFSNWVTENDGRDAGLLVVMEHEGLWDMLCDDLKKSKSAVVEERLLLLDELNGIVLSHDESFSMPLDVVQDVVENIDRLVGDAVVLSAACRCMTSLIRVDCGTDRDRYIEEIPEICARLLNRLYESYEIDEEVGMELVDALLDDDAYDLIYGYSRCAFDRMFDDSDDCAEEEFSRLNFSHKPQVRR